MDAWRHFSEFVVAHQWLAAGARGACTALLGILILGGVGDLFARVT